MRAPVVRADAHQVRLMVRVARMYYEQGLRQTEISSRLHLSASKVSRLLKRASAVGVVRTVVSLPPGVHAELEERLERAYGLDEVVVTDVRGSHEQVLASLGAAGAAYLENDLAADCVLGVSAWSESLMCVARALPRIPGARVREVVQLDGGAGHAAAQIEASQMLDLFASRTGASPVVIPAPGVATNSSVHDVLMSDPSVVEAMSHWAGVSVALVSVGSLLRSALVRPGGNYASEHDLEELRDSGAVGDVCFRFFDAEGRAISSSFDERVIGMDLERLRRVPRRIAVCGGTEKTGAIRSALLGGLVNVLVTDLGVAEELVDDAPGPQETAPATGRP